MELEEALRQFDRAETNLHRLEEVNEEMNALVPDRIIFPGSSPEGLRHGVLRRSFEELVAALPAIDGFRIEVDLLTLDDVAQTRLDANDIGEPQVLINLGQALGAPGEAIAEYRHRFTRKRRQLVRERVEQLIREVDELLAHLTESHEYGNSSVAEDPEWQRLTSAVAEIRRLLGEPGSERARWDDLARHLSFALAVDLHDIANFDWPSVRPDIETRLYAEDEPLPVATEDLGALVNSRPTGPVTTELNWSSLEAEDFERLVFNLLGDAPGYSNPEWLTNTQAPDRGRDLSVQRDLADPLSGTKHERVVVQCKDWTSKSVGPLDANEAVVKAGLWQPPFDVLIIATTGRFTTDAVDWIEQHNRTQRLRVEMWPDSRLEMLLAERAYLVEQFRLRPPST